MEYPLMINGKRSGSFTMERRGLYTYMEAWSESAPELTRLWMHGEGRSAYLGLMQPSGGGMLLRKRLSRSELEAYPQTPAYVSDSPEGPAREAETPPERVEKKGSSAPGEDISWHRCADGSLRSVHRGRELVALPAALRKTPPGVELREIEGREYMIFRY